MIARGIRHLALAAVLATASGADLLSELTWFGPVGQSDGGRDIDDGVLTATVAGDVAGPDRARGLMVGRRTGAGDGQASFGWARDKSWPIQNRVVARVGSDPLASEDGIAFGALGVVMLTDAFISFQGEVGRSAQRGLTTDSELSLALVRLRLTTDDDVDTLRIGVGWRWSGTMDPVAGSFLIDWARSDGRRGAERQGTICQGTMFYRAWNHVVVGGQLDLLFHAADPDGGSQDAARGSVLMGVAF
jgi:hypothetical protein